MAYHSCLRDFAVLISWVSGSTLAPVKLFPLRLNGRGYEHGYSPIALRYKYTTKLQIKCNRIVCRYASCYCHVTLILIYCVAVCWKQPLQTDSEFKLCRHFTHTYMGRCCSVLCTSFSVYLYGTQER